MFLALFVATVVTLIAAPFILIFAKRNKRRKLKVTWVSTFIFTAAVYVVGVIINGITLYQTV